MDEIVSGDQPLRVVTVSPTYFAPESVLGGGERYAEELSAALARTAGVSVRLVSFGPRAFRERPLANFERVILKSWTRDRLTPFSPRLFAELRDADVLHCFQRNVFPTFLAAWSGHRRGLPVFVTDLGGGGWTPGYHLDIARWVTAELPLSDYAAQGLDARRPHQTIYGGVNLARYPERAALEHDGSVVFLGRVLPHKGVHFLIAGLPEGVTLQVIGTVADGAYLTHLRSLARGKDVQFLSGLADEDIVARLSRAMALVHPTPVDERGSAGAHELFGLALVEAMACGCPVIASRAASLPEIVENEATGFLVAPNDPAAIGTAITTLSRNRERWREMAVAARHRVEARFTWEMVAARALAAYREWNERESAQPVTRNRS